MTGPVLYCVAGGLNHLEILLRAIRTVFYKAGYALISLLNTVLITRYLSIEDKGVYSIVTTWVVFATIFLAGYGNFFNYGVNRLKFARAEVVGEMARLFVGIAVADTVLFAIAIALAPRSPLFFDGAIMFGAIPFMVYTGYASRLLQSMNEIDWINRLNMVQPGFLFAVATALSLIRHFGHGALTGQLFALTLGAWMASYMLAAFVIYVVARRKAGVPFRPRRNRHVAAAMHHYGWNLSWQNLLTQFNLRGDANMLLVFGALYPYGWAGLSAFFSGRFPHYHADTRAVAFYGIAVVGSETLWYIGNSIALMVYTRIAHRAREDSVALTEQTFRINFWLMIVCGLILYFVLSPLIPVILPRYAPSVAPFRILLIGSMAYGGINVLTQFFTDQLGRVRYPMYMQAGAFALNVLVCAALIPNFWLRGAAWGSNAGYLLCLAASVWYFHRHTGRPIRRLFLLTAEDRRLLLRFLPAAGVRESGE